MHVDKDLLFLLWRFVRYSTIDIYGEWIFDLKKMSGHSAGTMHLKKIFVIVRFGHKKLMLWDGIVQTNSWAVCIPMWSTAFPTFSNLT